MLSGGILSGFSSLTEETDNPIEKPFPKPKVQPFSSGKLPAKKPVQYDMGGEIRKYGRTSMAFDDKPVNEIVKNVGTKMGVNPSMLFSSAWQEGMNAAALRPDDISSAYKEHEKELEGFPVDGFLNYGLDTIGERYEAIKKYLPEGFESKLKFYKTTNEKNQPITTAAFKTNEDALVAKAAFLRSEMDTVDNYAKEKGIELDDKARNYFTLASYNAGFGNSKQMIDEYSKAKDKEKFINEGLTSRKGVHKNIKPRMDNMIIADELLKD